jgi:hypothetical protein
VVYIASRRVAMSSWHLGILTQRDRHCNKNETRPRFFPEYLSCTVPLFSANAG